MAATLDKSQKGLGFLFEPNGFKGSGRGMDKVSIFIFSDNEFCQKNYFYDHQLTSLDNTLNTLLKPEISIFKLR